MTQPRRSTDRSNRRAVYVAVALFYVLLFLAVIWPIYPAFATIEPRILGMPFSMAYVVAALLLSFSALLWLYVWEGPERGAEPRSSVDEDAG